MGENISNSKNICNLKMRSRYASAQLANQIAGLKDSKPSRPGKGLRKMSSHPNLRPWSHKHNNASVTKRCLLQSNDLPVCSLIWKSAIVQSIVRTYGRCLLSLQHMLLNMMVNLHWQTPLVERAKINLKPSLVILFTISERFSCKCALEAVTKEAFQNSAAAHGNKCSQRHMRRIVLAGSLSPVLCKGLPTGLSTVFFSLRLWDFEMQTWSCHPCSWSSLDKNKNS